MTEQKHDDACGASRSDAGLATSRTKMEQAGICCYGGIKPKKKCDSCAAWKPITTLEQIEEAMLANASNEGPSL